MGAPDNLQHLDSQYQAHNAEENDIGVVADDGLEDEAHGDEDDPRHHEALVGGVSAEDETGAGDAAEDTKNTPRNVNDQ